MYYAEFFQLKEAPFSIAPNPRYLFMSERHREALALLLYGVVNGNGFVALTGEVGTGKTTLCNCLLNQLPDNVDLALLLNPRVNAEELLATLCDELEIAYPEGSASLKVLLDALTLHLLRVHARGRNTVLLIDEAQNLSIQVLEQIRLLTNLETNDTKLLQIVLVGQPELNQLLAQKNLRQLNQRITARYHINSLSLADCFAYIEHRLRVAGSSYPVFSRRAVKKVFQFSGGIPRLINIICDRAMLGAYSLGTHRVEAKIVSKAAGEVLLPGPSRSDRYSYWKWMVALILIGVFSGLYLFDTPKMLLPIFNRHASDADRAADRSNTMEDPRPASQARIDNEVIASRIPAANADFRSEPAQQPVDPPTAKIQAYASHVIDAIAPGQPISAPLAKIEEIRHPPASDPDQPKIPFSEAISDPGLTLYAALPHLFSQWNINNEPMANNFCEAARRSGLRCLIQQGTWNYLVNLNTPATLEFVLNKGITRYATLIKVDDESATFTLPSDNPISFPVSEVLPFWQGQFALLWKPPAHFKTLLIRGYTNPAVTWLREQLRSQYGKDSENPVSDYFDRELEDRVISFQSDHGLETDGKVGAETIILLNTLGGSPEIPKLRARSN
ncbi:MAG: AAA family ATPase [Methylococcales bacterium]